VRIINADVGHSGEVHKLYLEYCRDVGITPPATPNFWFWKFHDQKFHLLLIKHGKKPVGFWMGHVVGAPIYDKNQAFREAIFIRRGFRGKIGTTRKIVRGLKNVMRQVLNVDNLTYTQGKPREKRLNG
jgi:hypothetical protein